MKSLYVNQLWHAGLIEMTISCKSCEVQNIRGLNQNFHILFESNAIRRVGLFVVLVVRLLSFLASLHDQIFMLGVDI